jgi:hypothetical protein
MWALSHRDLQPDCVVADAPLIDEDFGFPKQADDFVVQQFVAESGAKALLAGRVLKQPPALDT